MKTFTNRLLLIACLVLPMLAGCKKEEAPQQVEAAPLTAPTTQDENAWSAYLVDVVKRNMEGINSTPYLYTLPASTAADFQGAYDRQLEKAQGDVGRGIIEGNLLAFGGPESAKMADLVIAAFSKVDAASMKGVRVLFIGDAADNERVKAAVTPAGVDYRFIEAK